MVIVLTAIIGFVSILLGKFIFRYFFNPITLYVVVWGTQIFLYELKLIRYSDLSTEAWMLIGIAFFCFLFGILFYYVIFSREPSSVTPSSDRIPMLLENRPGVIHFLIIVFAIIGTIGALQHWMVLLRKFGSLPNVFLNAYKIYQMRMHGEIKGYIPYVTSFLFVSIFFTGMYAGHRGRFPLGGLLAFIGVVLEDIAHMGRVQMLFALLEFLIVTGVYRMGGLGRVLRIKKMNVVLIFLFSFIFFAFFATVIKSVRAGVESYKSATLAIKKLNKDMPISPSIYLYFSSQIVVFSKYLEKEAEVCIWGENTFLPIYNLIAKTGWIERPRFYQKGYYIPMWTNTGTYLREVHADFGYSGIFIVPFLLGFASSFCWFGYVGSKNTNYFIFLTYLLLIIGFSFLMMITRLGIWWISLFFVLISVALLNRFSLAMK